MTIKFKRLDHHGIVAGVIDDLNMVFLLDKHLPQDDKQEIPPGEAIKGMIMNGLVIINCHSKLGLLSHLKRLQIKTKCKKQACFDNLTNVKD
ncbi:DUF4277 domain-containing protein [Paraglaciecola sp. MB-3u-78]|uniref:DUF4277 domain-containing protein n=1 Tax=Paraglaciecola sp. MB-3u-78 TaxID=2058332 RepID=UPI000C344366|nr:DUF4277 domain-containing protein [Paraglaciecola sp. MB-3u-78]PKG97455.1 hypothetical protein CXF95_19055 [Paraglaciecola sp. MB-3u-78]